MKIRPVLLLMLAAILAEAAPAQNAGTEVFTCTITACIDGEDLLYVQGSALYWQHEAFQAVGQTNNCASNDVQIDTTANAVPVLSSNWQPLWAQDPAATGSLSTPFVDLDPPLPAGPTMLSFTALEARGSLTVSQVPAAWNGWTLILDFNDESEGGSALYQGLITVTAPTPQPALYDPLTTRMSIPVLHIGAATYTDVVLEVAGIVSISGNTLDTVEDSYDPATNELTLPLVLLDSGTYDNVVVSVSRLDSIGGASGCDVYDGTYLVIPSVAVDGAIYEYPVVTLGAVLAMQGGMPGLAQDSYVPATRELSIPAVLVDGQLYTNVMVTVGTIETVGNGPLAVGARPR